MNSESPRDLAFYIAFASAAIIGAISIVSRIILSVNFNWLAIGSTVFFSGVAIFFISKILIEKFIYNKIKLIYKTIQKTKRKKNDPIIDPSEDMLNKVKSDVESWAEETKIELEQLQIKEAFSREFSGNVAHELKTPIFNIQGYILTLLEGGLEDENINRKYLERAEKSVERMINLVEDLDTITRIEAKQLNLKIAKENIVEIATDIIEIMEDNAETKGIKIRFNKQYDTPILVKCDKKRIMQVFTNLISNAIKYGKEGGSIEVRFYDMDENILVEIADDGLGIDTIHLPRLFERFYRVEESRARDTGGTGLGLAIVKHLIEAHKQTINVRSTKDVGSTFSFTLAKG